MPRLPPLCHIRGLSRSTDFARACARGMGGVTSCLIAPSDVDPGNTLSEVAFCTNRPPRSAVLNYREQTQFRGLPVFTGFCRLCPLSAPRTCLSRSFAWPPRSGSSPCSPCPRAMPHTAPQHAVPWHSSPSRSAARRCTWAAPAPPVLPTSSPRSRLQPRCSRPPSGIPCTSVLAPMPSLAGPRALRPWGGCQRPLALPPPVWSATLLGSAPSQRRCGRLQGCSQWPWSQCGSAGGMRQGFGHVPCTVQLPLNGHGPSGHPSFESHVCDQSHRHCACEY